MNTKTVWLVSLIGAASLVRVGAAAPVKTEGGLVEGTVADGLTIYRGIPFGMPPVGDLRWRPPQPAAKWPGVLHADKFAPACMQGGPPPANGRAMPGLPPSEDCLYLNVWTPANATSDRLPVLVWIYGGGFVFGATSIPLNSGEQLAKRGVVFVSIAYRVGPMGFMAHPGLTAESKNHSSGNYGMLDMIEGLKWVHRNIASFGGNPAKVTIMGESAGGIAVSQLCASPLARGLFQGAISESGGSFGPPRSIGLPGENMLLLADAERAGEAYAGTIGATSIKDLRKLPADKVLETARGRQGLAWPVVDGWAIPDDQYKLYEAKRYNDTPILVGYNSDEGISFSPPRTPEAYIAGTRQRYGPFADSLLKLYPTEETVVPKTARDLTRDAAFGWHTWTWARLQSKTGKSKAFLYYFDQHPDYPAGSPQAGGGSPHASEMIYVFQHLKAQATPEDHVISDAMATYWTNFTKRGDPNGEGVPQWLAFSDANPSVMHFAKTPHQGPVPSVEGLKGLDAYFAWRRTDPEGIKLGSSK
jgi:para-nitrobenzyl esterase